MDEATRFGVLGDVFELRRHHQALLGRLRIETNRHKRIALEDNIIAVKALIRGLRKSLVDAAGDGGRDD